PDRDRTVSISGSQVLPVGAERNVRKPLAIGSSEDAGDRRLLRVPDHHSSVIPSRGDTFPVRAVGHAVELAPTLEDENSLLGLGIPDPQGVILTRRHELLAVRAERHADDETGVTEKGGDVNARLRIPDLHGPVRTGRGKLSSIWRIGYAVDA